MNTRCQCQHYTLFAKGETSNFCGNLGITDFMHLLKVLNLCQIINTSRNLHDSSSINDCKLQLRSYLHKLELEGWVNRADGYQTIVTAIAKDICNKKKYRVMRDKELQTLRATKERLEEKTKYYEEQVEFYNQYIQRCLENLHTGKGYFTSVFFNRFPF